MDLIRKCRWWLANAVFAAILCWPFFHLLGSLAFGFSPWRFFGWGMYAAPHPESLSRVDVIFSPRSTSSKPPEIDPAPPAVGDEPCLHVWLENKEVAIEGLCENPEVEDRVARVLHYRNFPSAENLIKTVELRRGKINDSSVWLVITHQRFSLWHSTASVQREFFLKY